MGKARGSARIRGSFEHALAASGALLGRACPMSDTSRAVYRTRWATSKGCLAQRKGPAPQSVPSAAGRHRPLKRNSGMGSRFDPTLRCGRSQDDPRPQLAPDDNERRRETTTR